MEQRAGRIIRQGNENSKVEIYRYVTEQTFDAYLYQLVEGKQKFASQIMSSKSPALSADDIDETALSYAEIKMLATGNPLIKEKMDLDLKVNELKVLRSAYLSQKFNLEDAILKIYPAQIAKYNSQISGLEKDIQTAKENPKTDTFCGMTVLGVPYFEKSKAGLAIINACKTINSSADTINLGEYRGFKTEICFDSFLRICRFILKGKISHSVDLGTDANGNIVRIDNAIKDMPSRLTMCKTELENTMLQLENAKAEVEKSFAFEGELKQKSTRLDELNTQLNLDVSDEEIVDEVKDEVEKEKNKKYLYHR